MKYRIELIDGRFLTVKVAPGAVLKHGLDAVRRLVAKITDVRIKSINNQLEKDYEVNHE